MSKIDWTKINWAVVWSTLRGALMAGGPVATLLIALDFPPVEVGKWTAIGLGAVGVLSYVVPAIIGAFTHTDSATIAKVEAMEPGRVVAALPDTAKVAAAESMPGVTLVVDATAAPQAAVDAALDPRRENVLPHP